MLKLNNKNRWNKMMMTMIMMMAKVEEYEEQGDENEVED